MFAFKIIFLIIIVSGIIAYVGDWIGRIIGKKRLSIFGMRPRYTAVAITVISGILIASFTLLIFVVLSREARLALFNLEDLRQRIVTLEGIKKKLEGEIEVSRKGTLLFRNNDVILTTLIRSGQDKKAFEAKLKQILSFLDLYISNLGVSAKGKSLIYIAQEKFDSVLSSLLAAREDQVIQARVTRNVIFGEQVPIDFVLIPNRLIFQKGEEINRVIISTELSDPEIEQKLKNLLSEARITAQQKGVLPDSSGSLGSISYADIFETVNEVKNRGGEVAVKLVVNQTVRAIGPLSVSFEL